MRSRWAIARTVTDALGLVLNLLRSSLTVAIAPTGLVWSYGKPTPAPPRRGSFF
ncbi:MAG: hypothetical protein F6J93_01640 [Oscillatoria sp. SIO1A7]|nr:hypothetical protein [Oscillatoria sp. SIO1A7]